MVFDSILQTKDYRLHIKTKMTNLIFYSGLGRKLALLWNQPASQKAITWLLAAFELAEEAFISNNYTNLTCTKCF